MSSNAQRDLYEDFNELPLAATGTDGGAALRRIAAERLAAHRTRRSSNATAAPAPRTEPRISETAQRVRDAVAARYRQSPSYQEALATPPPPEPQRVPQQAQPQQAPSRTWIDEPLVPVKPVAQAQFLEEPAPADVFNDPFFTGETSPAISEPVAPVQAVEAPVNSAPSFNSFEVRPYSDLPTPTWVPERTQQAVAPAHPDEMQSLDDEIAFRLAPEFEQHYIEPLPIQANVVEFPRQLVAARKARPRLAEGPLRSDASVEPQEAPAPEPTLFDAVPASSDFQMRIFEVDTREADWSAPSPAVEVAPESPVPAAVEHEAPEWQHLMLDARDHHAPVAHAPAEPELEAPPVARIELRLMAALVDAACIGMAFVIFSTVTALINSHALEGLSYPLIFAAGFALLLVLTVIYQAMFFTLGASTPGMYYAHLEFRTLSGRPPSRGLLRRRVTANLLAAAPIGAGLLWSLIDGRRLGWNDKLSGVFLQEL